MDVLRDTSRGSEEVRREESWEDLLRNVEGETGREERQEALERGDPWS